MDDINSTLEAAMPPAAPVEPSVVIDRAGRRRSVRNRRLGIGIAAASVVLVVSGVWLATDERPETVDVNAVADGSGASPEPTPPPAFEDAHPGEKRSVDLVVSHAEPLEGSAANVWIWQESASPAGGGWRMITWQSRYEIIGETSTGTNGSLTTPIRIEAFTVVADQLQSFSASGHIAVSNVAPGSQPCVPQPQAACEGMPSFDPIGES